MAFDRDFFFIEKDANLKKVIYGYYIGFIHLIELMNENNIKYSISEKRISNAYICSEMSKDLQLHDFNNKQIEKKLISTLYSVDKKNTTLNNGFKAIAVNNSINSITYSCLLGMNRAKSYAVNEDLDYCMYDEVAKLLKSKVNITETIESIKLNERKINERL